MNQFPPLEHAIFLRRNSGEHQAVARSPGFVDEWSTEAERLCAGFGERPSGVACPAAVFAQPFGRGHVAVVQVMDQGTAGELAFHVVVAPDDAYRLLGGDPFHVAEHCPSPWLARGELPALSCPLPLTRSVAEVLKIVQSPDSAALLGGAQALLDGGRLVFRRDAPALALLRGLWTLLPDSSRRTIWPATFAFGNTLQFHVLVMPQIDPETVPRYLSEDAAADYPEGKYEHALQRAAENDDQATLDALFNRRSYREIRNLGLLLLIVALFIPLLFRLVGDGVDKEKDNKERRGAENSPVFDMPGKEAFTRLDDRALAELTADLRELARKLPGVVTPRPIDEATPEELLQAIDVKLGVPDKKRQGGPLRNLGPIERQLRGLVWKHAIDSYNDMNRTPRELLQALQEKVVPKEQP